MIKKTAVTIDNLFRLAEALSHSAFTRLAPAVTPLANAGIFAIAVALAVYAKIAPLVPRPLAIGIAVTIGAAAAIGLEASGYRNFETAIRAFPKVGWVAALLPALYLLIGIVTLWFVEDVATAVLGTAMFLLTGSVYASRALEIHTRMQRQQEAAVQTEQAAAREMQEQAAREQRQHDAALQMKQLQMEHELKLAQAQHKADVAIAKAEQRTRLKLAQASTQPAESGQPASKERAEAGYLCEYCQQKRSKTRAGLNAHYRFCKPYQQAKRQQTAAAVNGTAAAVKG